MVGRRWQEVVRATVPFVLARWQESGGFGAIPTLPATIEDTYHALNILCLARAGGGPDPLGGDAERMKRLRRYLADCLRILPAGPRTYFHLLSCCQLAGLALDHSDIEAGLSRRMRESSSLQAWYFCSRVQVEILEKRPAPPDHLRVERILGRGWRTVAEAWMQLYLCRWLSVTLPMGRTALVRWFQAAQNGDGGFGFLPGTTSFVENCHQALRALAALDADPLEPDRAARFLLACQGASGGFGRSSRSTPFLDATWHALAALKRLAGRLC